MAELPEDDPRLGEALQELGRALNRYLGQPMNQQTLMDITFDVDYARAKFKTMHGHDFPPLKPFLLPSSGFIVLYRTDIDDEQIQQKVLFLLRDFARANIPVVTQELAAAIKHVWPHYQPPIEDIQRISKVKFLN